MAEKEVDSGQAASLNADFIAGIAHHGSREHNSAGRGQHSHHQGYQRQGKPSAFEQVLHGRYKPLRKTDVLHRSADDIDQQEQGRKRDEKIARRLC